MCYAIPGRVVGITGRIAEVDYFGEKRRAYTDLVEDIALGDNVYAQGGFLIRKISPAEAGEVLNAWSEIFFKLKEQDKKLAADPKDLYERANAIRQKYQDNSCCVHCIIEFSNYCRQNCLYCGIRRGNADIQRYRMELPEILEAVGDAVKLGFQAFVLQSGEDLYYNDDMLEAMVREIRAKYPVLLFMSVGERSISAYKKMYDAGARGVLLRFETSNESIYDRMKSLSLNARLNLIKNLRQMGYLIITGSLIGLPGQKNADIMKDIKLAGKLGAEMFSFGPFIPHQHTPLAEHKTLTLKKMLNILAQARIMHPSAKILVTTALETLWGIDGAKHALMAGANSLMINVTPQKYRSLYDIYPKRFGTELDVNEHIGMVIKLLRSIGRAPTDLSVMLL